MNWELECGGNDSKNWFCQGNIGISGQILEKDSGKGKPILDIHGGAHVGATIGKQNGQTGKSTNYGGKLQVKLNF